MSARLCATHPWRTTVSSSNVPGDVHGCLFVAINVQVLAAKTAPVNARGLLKLRLTTRILIVLLGMYKPLMHQVTATQRLQYLGETGWKRLKSNLLRPRPKFRTHPDFDQGMVLRCRNMVELAGFPTQREGC